MLSTLPAPNATEPDSTTTFDTQSAIYDSLPILEELIGLFEHYEESTITREVAKRRTRLGAAGPEQIQREVGREVMASSRVSLVVFLPKFDLKNKPSS